MFGEEPGAERRKGVLNQHVVSILESEEVAYYVLHTRAESPRSILITALTKHFKEKSPDKSPGEIGESVMRLVVAINKEKTFASLQQYERVKDTKLVTPDSDHIGANKLTLEDAVNRANTSCVLGIVNKVTDDQ